MKVDLRKAYDTLEWGFLRRNLIDLGFPFKFVQWIMACVTTMSYSLVLNGGLTKPFKGKRGTKQGDPMSPYLFVIAMEYLGRELRQLHKNGDFNFHPRCRNLNTTHICFADDLLMYCRADFESISILIFAFHRFSVVSGLQANMDKSAIYMAGILPTVK
ncbi:secreted RxLR effector protein 78-like [Nicotiana tabacum]|uniref:Secreted RxLR effector protein 78-like n=1 Tax=Nicotiana tabacum TaxID=4097 RepID=A0AC58TTV1_TOBAC